MYSTHRQASVCSECGVRQVPGAGAAVSVEGAPGHMYLHRARPHGPVLRHRFRGCARLAMGRARARLPQGILQVMAASNKGSPDGKWKL